MIDDGSTDESGQICKGFVADDLRFRYLHSSHVGCSDARNKGINCAQGQFVTFVDSDDYVTPDYLSTLFFSLQSGCADLSVQGLCRISGHRSEIRGSFQDAVFDLLYQSDSFFQQLSVVTSGSVCAKLFKLEIIRSFGILFHSDILLAEDMGFLMEYLLHTDTVALDSHISYFYVGNDKSSTTCYWDFFTEQRGYLHLSALWDSLMKQYPSTSLLADYDVFVGNYINRMVYSAIAHPSNDLKRKHCIDLLRTCHYPLFSTTHHPQSCFTYLLKWSAIHDYYGLYQFLMRLAIWRYHIPVHYK